MTITIFNLIVSIMEDEEDVWDKAIVKIKNEKKKIIGGPLTSLQIHQLWIGQIQKELKYKQKKNCTNIFDKPYYMPI